MHSFGSSRYWPTRCRDPQQQLRRFPGAKKGRKIHYGRVPVDALPHERVPAPLADLLDFGLTSVPDGRRLLACERPPAGA